jgi:DNA-binding GntR family transcriptional regulator
MLATKRPRKKRTAPLEVSKEGEALSETVYHRLLEDILTGHYPHGTVISELGLARVLGVSRTPVHDALRQLAKDGLVHRERNCRARVAGLSRDDIFEVFEMRKLLEGPAAELAAARMDRRHLAPLRAAADALQAKPLGRNWTSEWAEFDDLFHRTIADASGNRRLAQDINRYRLLHKGFNRLATEPGCLQAAMAEHMGILAALEAHNGPLARKLMVAHIVVWQDYFIRTVPPVSSQPNPA